MMKFRTMTTTGRRAGTACALALSLVLALAPMLAVAKDFDDEATIAADNAESPKGKDYAPAAESAFQSKHANAARKCFMDQNDAEASHYRIILEIDGDGKIVSANIEPLDEHMGCLDEAIEGKLLPHPPFAPFHLMVDLKR
jgi:hypothetical protein